jgi:hypothetical protein
MEEELTIMKCTLCHCDIYLQCSDDDPYKISGEPVCRHCYFKELGEVVEKYPIGFQFYKQEE